MCKFVFTKLKKPVKTFNKFRDTQEELIKEFRDADMFAEWPNYYMHRKNPFVAYFPRSQVDKYHDIIFSYYHEI